MKEDRNGLKQTHTSSYLSLCHSGKCGEVFLSVFIVLTDFPAVWPTSFCVARVGKICPQAQNILPIKLHLLKTSCQKDRIDGSNRGKCLAMLSIVHFILSTVVKWRVSVLPQWMEILPDLVPSGRRWGVISCVREVSQGWWRISILLEKSGDTPAHEGALPWFCRVRKLLSIIKTPSSGEGCNSTLCPKQTGLSDSFQSEFRSEQVAETSWDDLQQSGWGELRPSWLFKTSQQWSIPLTMVNLSTILEVLKFSSLHLGFLPRVCTLDQQAAYEVVDSAGIQLPSYMDFIN